MTTEDLRALLPAHDPHPFDPVASRLIDAALELIDSSMRLYTTRQAAKMLGISESSLKMDLASGKLRITHKFSERRNLISHEELRRYVESHRNSRRPAKV